MLQTGIKGHHEQTVIPSIVSYAYHNGAWRDREYKNWQKLFSHV